MRIAVDGITKMALENNAIRLENIDHGNYKFFNQSTIDNIIELTKDNSKVVLNTTGRYTTVNFQISLVIEYNLHDIMKLAYYGWSVTRIADNKVSLVSFKACKLQAISKHINGLESDIKHISISRFDGNDIMETWNGINKDIIKSCQSKDRHFTNRMVTERKDKILLEK